MMWLVVPVGLVTALKLEPIKLPFVARLLGHNTSVCR